jgi:hypothetical protein
MNAATDSAARLAELQAERDALQHELQETTVEVAFLLAELRSLERAPGTLSGLLAKLSRLMGFGSAIGAAEVRS